MIDTHCHLNLKPLVKNWQQHLDAATKAGVTKIIIPGVDTASNNQAIKISNKSDICYAAVGYHPHEASSNYLNLSDLKQQLIKLVEKDQAIAIGECGLDYYRLPQDHKVQDFISSQHQLFSLQLEIAKDFNLPLSIHIRDAQADALKFLSQFKPKGVLHCFSGGQEYLETALKLGLYVSFAGNITYGSATDLQSLIKHVPLDRLLLETDAPYLNPNRGQFPNTPANIEQTYHFVAKLLNLTVSQLSNQILANASKLFKI